jgi:predicted RNA-binding Zn-ribbon protein involved in translation (DUF1610 family)
MARRNQRREKKSGKLAPGFCRICGRIIGGLSGLTVWWCPRCWKLLCKDCCLAGSVIKKSVCPECGTEVQPIRRRKPSKYPVFIPKLKLVEKKVIIDAKMSDLWKRSRNAS